MQHQGRLLARGRWMLFLEKLLVVDDSKVFREMLRMLLRPCCNTLLVASSCEEASQALATHPDVDLVVLDRVLGPEDGLDVLEQIAKAPEPRPRVVVVTATPDPRDAERAARLGAIGYLVKPITTRDLSAVWESHRKPRRADARRVRRVPLGRAVLSDPAASEDPMLCFEIQDLSMTGALLVTQGPIAPGTVLELDFVFGARRAPIRVEVVRLQEPGWLQPGGVGVRFAELADEARELLLDVHRAFGIAPSAGSAETPWIPEPARQH